MTYSSNSLQKRPKYCLYDLIILAMAVNNICNHREIATKVNNRMATALYDVTDN